MITIFGDFQASATSQQASVRRTEAKAELIATDSAIGTATVAARVAMDELRTATAVAVVTQEARQTATAKSAATATAVAAASTVNRMQVNDNLLANLPNGELYHVEDDYVETELIGEDVGDFILEVDFVNPYGHEENDWSYGVLFRYLGSNDQYRFIISSNQYWSLRNRYGDSSGEEIARGSIENLIRR